MAALMSLKVTCFFFCFFAILKAILRIVFSKLLSLRSKGAPTTDVTPVSLFISFRNLRMCTENIPLLALLFPLLYICFDLPSLAEEDEEDEDLLIDLDKFFDLLELTRKGLLGGKGSSISNPGIIVLIGLGDGDLDVSLLCLGDGDRVLPRLCLGEGFGVGLGVSAINRLFFA